MQKRQEVCNLKRHGVWRVVVPTVPARQATSRAQAHPGLGEHFTWEPASGGLGQACQVPPSPGAAWSLARRQAEVTTCLAHGAGRTHGFLELHQNLVIIHAFFRALFSTEKVSPQNIFWQVSFSEGKQEPCITKTQSHQMIAVWHELPSSFR